MKMTLSRKTAYEKKEIALKKLVMELNSRELIEFKNGSIGRGMSKALHEPRIFDRMGTGV